MSVQEFSCSVSLQYSRYALATLPALRPVCSAHAPRRYLQERPIFYRRYTTLHLLVTVAAFSVAAVWIALSAARHSEAKSKCDTRFFSNTDEPSEADTLCNIFPWVDIGLMGGLWVLLFIAQVRLRSTPRGAQVSAH